MSPRGWLLVVAAMGVVASPAAAQVTPNPMPAAGDIVGASGKTPRQQLDLNWSLLGAYDNSLAADGGGFGSADQQASGAYSTVNAGMTYVVHGQHATFSASGSSGGRYYRAEPALNAIDGAGRVGVTADLGARTKIQATQSFSYQPYYQFNFFSGPGSIGTPLATNSTQTLVPQASDTFSGDFVVSEQLTPRSTLTFDYNYRYTRFDGEEQPFLSQAVSARFSHHVSRYASLRLGYGYGKGSDSIAPNSSPVAIHSLDVGVDYARPLSFSRRTTISFSSGLTAVPENGTTYYRFIGEGTLNRAIARTWNVNVNYKRGVEFEEGFSGPIYADTLLLGVAGSLSRRTRFGVSGSYAAGQIGVSSGVPGFSTYTGSTDLSLAVTRTLFLYAQYFYYRYNFDQGAPVPYGLPYNLNRQGVRFGLSGRVPLFRPFGATH